MTSEYDAPPERNSRGQIWHGCSRVIRSQHRGSTRHDMLPERSARLKTLHGQTRTRISMGLLKAVVGFPFRRSRPDYELQFALRISTHWKKRLVEQPRMPTRRQGGGAAQREVGRHLLATPRSGQLRDSENDCSICARRCSGNDRIAAAPRPDFTRQSPRMRYADPRRGDCESAPIVEARASLASTEAKRSGHVMGALL